MSGNASDPTTLFVRQEGQGGHAITPYAITSQGNGIFWVKVYDNNYPDDSNRYVVINTTTDTWSYDLGSGLGTWSGDTNTHSLGIVPISKYAEQPICPWCSSSWILSRTPTAQVWLNGAGHLLISDSKNRRIGFVGNQYVNNVPGASKGDIDGGLGIPMEPIYTLPLTETYTILLDGQTLTQTTPASLAQFGPGYAVEVSGDPLGPSNQDQITIANDGNGLAYNSSTAKQVTLTIALDGATESYQFQTTGADIGTGQVVTLTADLVDGKLVFNNYLASGGSYDLHIVRVTNTGRYIFVNRNITISATDTQYIDFGTWDGSGQILLEIDHGSDGSIDETIPLDNQVTWMYLPMLSK